MSVLNLTADTALVNIVTLQGDDYDVAIDEINNLGGAIDAAAQYLAQWDYGSDTDLAEQVNNPTPVTLGVIRRWQHQVHPAAVGGLDYLVVFDHRLGLYSLYRQPLNQED